VTAVDARENEKPAMRARRGRGSRNHRVDPGKRLHASWEPSIYVGTSALPGYRWFHVFRNVGNPHGVYVGVCLTLVFTAWLVIATRAVSGSLCDGTQYRAAAILCFLAAVPIFRFLRLPGHLMASGLLGWLIFSVSYRALCFIFRGLQHRLSTFHVFMFGSGRVHDTHHALLDCRRDLESP